MSTPHNGQVSGPEMAALEVVLEKAAAEAKEVLAKSGEEVQLEEQNALMKNEKLLNAGLADQSAAAQAAVKQSRMHFEQSAWCCSSIFRS